jgi:hypothetical protein
VIINLFMQLQLNKLKNSRPIIFMHYGDAPHLEFTFRAALSFNQQKDVILLGDEHNKKYEQLGVKHFYFKDLNTSDEIKRFHQVFKIVRHRDFGMDTRWIKFVTERFFYLNEFVSKNKISGFWTFDTDNLILTDLSLQEQKFQTYDYTTQNHGMSMQGFIHNGAALAAYVKAINTLFTDVRYVEKKQIKFSREVGALTEMDLYLSFSEKTNFRSIPLNSIIDQETFDDHITIPNDMEMHTSSAQGYRPVKKIYASENGDIFYRHLPTQSFVKVNTIDMSWTPLYLFQTIFKHARRKLNQSSRNEAKLNNLKVLDVRAPLHYQVTLKLKSLYSFLYPKK